MKKRNHRKLELSKETLHVTGGSVTVPAKEIGGQGTLSCLTCYFSCAERCDTNFQCAS